MQLRLRGHHLHSICFPGPEHALARQVRCYVGDNEERWFMWYNGRSAACPSLDAVMPAAGSIGMSWAPTH